jgi:uncharacterized membrane protein (UPF0127 family)
VSELADRPIGRLRGLMFRPGLAAGEGLLLTPAPAIHTAFMRFPIDAVFLTRELRVIRIVERLAPWHAASERRARSVLELTAGECGRCGIRVGDELELRDRATQQAPEQSPPDPDGEVLASDVREAVEAPAGQLARLQPLRILIVSPDRRFRTVMSLLLARRNCSVKATANAGRVAELIARERSDVIVADTSGWLADGSVSSALKALSADVGVVLVAEDPHARAFGSEVTAKWGPFEGLVDAIEQAAERRVAGTVG